jgi:hypothetical protein
MMLSEERGASHMHLESIWLHHGRRAREDPLPTDAKWCENPQKIRQNQKQNKAVHVRFWIESLSHLQLGPTY